MHKGFYSEEWWGFFLFNHATICCCCKHTCCLQNLFAVSNVHCMCRKWKTVLDYILDGLYILYLCAYGGLVKQKGRKSSKVEAQQSKLLVCDCVFIGNMTPKRLKQSLWWCWHAHPLSCPQNRETHSAENNTSASLVISNFFQALQFLLEWMFRLRVWTPSLRWIW